MDPINIKAFITDLDGTLTDGGYYVDCSGCVHKKYNTRDFYCMSILQDRGINVFVITSSTDDCDLYRMKKLGIPLVQGIKNKREFLEEVLFAQKNISWEDVFYIGDYLNDFECINKSRISACPLDSHEIIKNIDGNIVLSSKGGEACVAEAINWYLGLFDN